MTLNTIADKKSFEQFVGANPLAVVHFFAPWAAQCETMNAVLEELAKQPEFSGVKFAKVEAEELSDVAHRYKIEAVPTIILLKSAKVYVTVNGANAADLTAKLKKLVGDGTQNNTSQLSLNDRLKALVNKSPLMVFMKGNPEKPQCGFSKTLIGILNEAGVPYETFDILQDEDVRQGLKTFSNWPTFPQIYVKGDLIGGLDIIKELKESGELVDTLKGA